MSVVCDICVVGYIFVIIIKRQMRATDEQRYHYKEYHNVGIEDQYSSHADTETDSEIEI